MSSHTVSVIVVSRGRPDALVRCLTGLGQLFHSCFEVVVVADPAGCAAVRDLPYAERVKLVPYDLPNISAARNLGLIQAAGEIVAFVDDDSVPEPTWLDNLTAPFADPKVQSAGGYVRGRNGISFQSKGVWVRSDMSEQTELSSGVFQAEPGRAIKTVGTNCAFRRTTLCASGGFDPVFRFFLDETDVNLRFAAHRHASAIVPKAEVHHGFFASAYRTAARRPTALYQVAASLVAFLRKHDPQALKRVLEAEASSQRRRMLRHMMRGTCEPHHVGEMMKNWADGSKAGSFRLLRPPVPLRQECADFCKFSTGMRYSAPETRLHGRASRAVLENAVSDAARGARISLFFFDRTTRFHRVVYDRGVWVQIGGRFGKSDRSDPVFHNWSLQDRLAREVDRIAEVRGLSPG